MILKQYIAFVKSKHTAYFHRKKIHGGKLGRSKNAPEGNDLIDKSNLMSD